jgi:hypothetical protein
MLLKASSKFRFLGPVSTNKFLKFAALTWWKTWRCILTLLGSPCNICSARVKSRPGNRLSSLRFFVIFLSSQSLSFTIDDGLRQAANPVPESRGSHDHILLSQTWGSPPTWRARSPYLYLQETGWPSYAPRNLVSLSSPPTTRRATVEIFKPTSTHPSWLFDSVELLEPTRTAQEKSLSLLRVLSLPGKQRVP